MLKSLLFLWAGAAVVAGSRAAVRLPVVESRAADVGVAVVDVAAVEVVDADVAAVAAEVISEAVGVEKAPLATCVYTCGTVCYWQEDVDEALAQGYKDYKSGSSPGGYPHEYHDYEGFSFPTVAPWYEFPILSSYDPYTGGSPGPDRVIFDSKGAFDSVITHTGASGDNFVACKK